MPDTVMNIYKTAREVAGMTQERAAAALNLSVRSLAAYETGERIPHDDIVVRMVDLYNFQQLAVQHLRSNSELARRILPDLKKRSLVSAAVRFFNSMKRLEAMEAPQRMLIIGEDNVIDESESEDYETIATEMRTLIQSAMELMNSEQEETK